MDRAHFVRVVGPVFEHSPWIAERAWARRPFQSVKQLHEALCDTVRAASEEEKLALIRAHPDLVARMTALTAESQREQAAAGLKELSSGDVSLFENYNRE